MSVDLDCFHIIYNAELNLYSISFQEFTLTDDCVLQVHHEDPRLVQMTLLGEDSEFDKKQHFRAT